MPGADSAADFYDALEPFYALIYPDWPATCERQGAALDGILRTHFPAAREVLDATCGIGTQAIGLAARRYRVTASDVSPRSVGRLVAEAAKRGLDVPASVCDVRELAGGHGRAFDVVISCDNALPHLRPDDELPLALAQMWACTRPAGGCVISVRDYAVEDCGGRQVRPYGIRSIDGRDWVLLQTWTCGERSYDVTFYAIEDDGHSPPRCYRARGTYYPITTDRLAELMTAAGFVDVRRLDGVFFQPVLIGRRAG